MSNEKREMRNEEEHHAAACPRDCTALSRVSLKRHHGKSPDDGYRE
jgi:hypothetical protein